MNSTLNRHHEKSKPFIQNNNSVPKSVESSVKMSNSPSQSQKDNGLTKIMDSVSKNSDWKLEKFSDLIDKANINFDDITGNEASFTELFEYKTYIGSGGFGCVISAVDKNTDEDI